MCFRDSKDSRDGQVEEGKEVKTDVEATVPLPPTCAPADSVGTEGHGLHAPPHVHAEMTSLHDARNAQTSLSEETASKHDDDQRGTVGTGPGGQAETSGGRGSKEVSPDSDNVFHTASSSSSSSAPPSGPGSPARRRQDKSSLRKSQLNKASPEETGELDTFVASNQQLFTHCCCV